MTTPRHPPDSPLEMIDCGQFEKLSAYIDDALDADERAEVERHLFKGASCRHDYRDLRLMRGELRVDPAPEPLPQRLDLALTALAGRFVDERPLQSGRFQQMHDERFSSNAR